MVVELLELLELLELVGLPRFCSIPVSELLELLGFARLLSCGPQQVSNSRIPGLADSMTPVAKRAHGFECVGIVGIV